MFLASSEPEAYIICGGAWEGVCKCDNIRQCKLENTCVTGREAFCGKRLEQRECICAGMEVSPGGCQGDVVQAGLPEEPVGLPDPQKQPVLPAGIPEKVPTCVLKRGYEGLVGEHVSLYGVHIECISSARLSLVRA